MNQRLWRTIVRRAGSPLMPARWRSQILRALGCSIGQGSIVGDWTFVGSTLVRFGAGAGCGIDCFLDGSAPLVLEDHVRLGSCVRIITGTHDIEPTTRRRDLAKPTIGRAVRIGMGSWIGTGVTILPGVTIGEGCVVGAGSVVTGDCRPNSLYAGNPARFIKSLEVRS